MTTVEAAELVATLQMLYPNANLAKGAEKGYAFALGEFPAESVTGCLKQILDAHPTFCPGPAELRAFVRKVTQPEPSWELAWQDMLDQVKAVGSWSPPTFRLTATAEVVRIIGWSACLAIPDPKFGGDGRDRAFFQGRFREIYESVAARQSNAATLAALPEPTKLALERQVAS